jgi:rhodanese-related sulfurtransferase
MIRKLSHVSLAAILAVSSTVGWAYDQELAASYQRLFEPVTGAKAGKGLHLVPPEVLVEDLKKGKQFVAIDVRTPTEFGIFTMALPGSMVIPANEIFKPENLSRLPKDKQMLIVCKAGTRASAVGTALRHIGFDNVSILKGGYISLNKYLDPKSANAPLKPVKKNTI